MSITNGELNQIRAEVQRLVLPDTCIITHTAGGTVNSDGSDEPGAVTTTTVACRVAPSGGSPQETLIASRLMDVTPFTFTLPCDAAVNERDTITYQDGTYQVMGVLAPRSFQVGVRAVCRRIT